MKILVVGDGHSQIHEVAVTKAFRELGHQVETFYWNKYFHTHHLMTQQWLRVQNKFIFGPQINKINSDLRKMTLELEPHLIFIYRGTHIQPQTISQMKMHLPNCKIIGYNNDDPFAAGHPPWLWRHFIDGIPEYDLVLAYRQHNILDFQQAGAKRVELLRSWFIPERNHPIQLSDVDTAQFKCDIVFVGHYEPDHRVNLLESIVKNGWKLKIFGPSLGWNTVLKKSVKLKEQLPVHAVLGEDYNRALCGARIALCFLSKLNRDTYTRRCFEIPAAGTLLLSEYTDDLASLFREGEEADFFRTQEELLVKIERYLGDETQRKIVADAGLRRVHQDGHDVVSRMRQVLTWLDEMRE